MSWSTKIFGHRQERLNQESPEELSAATTATTLTVGDESLLHNFVLIRGGEFTMGSPLSEFLRGSDETQHQVRVSDFFLCKYPVTVAEFRSFVEASARTEAEKAGGEVNKRNELSGSVRSHSEENHPVLHVSWYDAVAYSQWLTKKTGKQFRIPTEAEWEYACRAGTTTPFNSGEELMSGNANYNGANPYKSPYKNPYKNPFTNNQKGVYRGKTVTANSFAPNAWGLYNMHGNVWEWCSDWFSGTYYNECKAEGTVSNPAGSATGSLRVLRGGGWNCDARLCRSAHRFNAYPYLRKDCVGFRLVLVP